MLAHLHAHCLPALCALPAEDGHRQQQGASTASTRESSLLGPGRSVRFRDSTFSGLQRTGTLMGESVPVGRL